MVGSFLRHAVVAAMAGVLAALAALSTPAAAPGRTDEVGPRTPGRDIGWPNCPPGLGIPERRTLGKPMPPARVRFVVVGLTNGPAFTPNPCLREQVATLARPASVDLGVRRGDPPHPAAAPPVRRGGTPILDGPPRPAVEHRLGAGAAEPRTAALERAAHADDLARRRTGPGPGPLVGGPGREPSGA